MSRSIVHVARDEACCHVSCMLSCMYVYYEGIPPTWFGTSASEMAGSAKTATDLLVAWNKEGVGEEMLRTNILQAWNGWTEEVRLRNS